MKKFILGIFTGLILVLLLIFLGVFALSRYLGAPSDPVRGETLLELKWPGSLPGHRISPLDSDLKAPLNLSGLRRAVRDAAGDERIRALLITGGVEIRREHIAELAEAVESFRALGKPVLAHLESGFDNAYLLACLADRVSLSPSAAGGLYLAGAALGANYMKELLDKLGIRVHVLHAGQAKQFGEEYSRDSMSPAVRENLELLVEDILREEVNWIAARRGIETAAVEALFTEPGRLSIGPAEALELGLVDALETRSQWESWLEQEFGGARRLAAASLLGGSSFPLAHRPKEEVLKDHVAVLWAEGGIMPAGVGEYRHLRSDVFTEQIRELADREAVRAVVLRVESPGGSALASEEIYQELLQLDAEKPLVVSMGPVAASGGYYISAPARKIWVSPFSITGSIGVAALLPDLSGAWDKLGLTADGVFPTTLSRLLMPGLEPEPEALRSLRDLLGRIYGEFKDRVTARRSFPPARMEELAGGRVWSGRRAVELGLADYLGGLDAAVAGAAKLAGATGLETVHYPPVMNLLELLLAGELNPRDLLPLAAGPAQELLANLAGADPLLARYVEELAGGRASSLPDPALLLRTEWFQRLRE